MTVRWLLPIILRRAAVGIGAMVLCAATVRAEAPGPSPAAHLDLTRPQFDTTTSLRSLDDLGRQASNTTVAEIDGRAITLGEVGDALRDLGPSYNDQSFTVVYGAMLMHLVEQQALVIQAQRHGLDADIAVKRRIKTAVDNILAAEWLQRASGADITEVMVLKRYDELYAGKPGPEQVHVRIILVPTEKEAADLIAEIGKGADFAAVAKASSQDPSAGRGGDLGFLARDGLNAEVGAVAFSMRPGEVSPFPVATAARWCVVKVEERRRGAVPTFPEVRESLVAAIRRERLGAVLKEAMAGVTFHTYPISGKQGEHEPVK